jgi:hypothetical protein
MVMCYLARWRSFLVCDPFQKTCFVGCEGAGAWTSPDIVLWGIISLIAHADPASAYFSCGCLWSRGRFSLGVVEDINA